jgi:hypothetical protein
MIFAEISRLRTLAFGVREEYTQSMRRWRVTIDGSVIKEGFTSEDRAWIWILHNQGNSVHYAMTYLGYDIEEY